MRDILITVVILGSLPFILRSPRVGVYVWAWLAMMIPHRAAFGFARALPFGQIVAIATLVSFLLSRERRPFPISSTTVVYIALVLWIYHPAGAGGHVHGGVLPQRLQGQVRVSSAWV